MAGALLHGQELDAFADAGYQGVHKREVAAGADVVRRGLRKKLKPFLEHDHDHVREEIEQLKASVRHKVEHPLRVIKRQFGFAKVRCPGLEKNKAQLVTLFALSNLWMVRRKLMATQG